MDFCMLIGGNENHKQQDLEVFVTFEFISASLFCMKCEHLSEAYGSSGQLLKIPVGRNCLSTISQDEFFQVLLLKIMLEMLKTLFLARCNPWIASGNTR